MDRDDQAIKLQATRRKARFPRVNFDETSTNIGSDYLIKHLVDKGGNVIIYGPSGSGKTFFTIDMVSHIAGGISWRGKRVKLGLVIYVASEAGESILRRFAAWRMEKLGEAREAPVTMTILTRGPNFLDKLDVAEFIADLKSLEEDWKRPIAVVVFDTVSRSIPGGDENTAKDMTRVVATADQIRDEFKAATVFVHHSGKVADHGPRGHSSLFAAADTVVCVEDRIATVEKSRDGVTGDIFPFDLSPVDLGCDQDGDPITTCVVIPSDAPPRAAKLQRLTADEALALAALKEVSIQLPETSVIPSGKFGANVDDWRRTFYVRLGESRDVEQSAKRQAFNRGKKGLLAKKLVGAYEAFAWIG